MPISELIKQMLAIEAKQSNYIFEIWTGLCNAPLTLLGGEGLHPESI